MKSTVTRKNKKQEGLPPRSHPDYMRLYAERNRARIRKVEQAWVDKKLEEDPDYFKRRYDSEAAADSRRRHGWKYSEAQWKERGIVDLTYERFKATLVAQNHRCKICERKFGSKLKPQADHNHDTGKFRGVLCISCNMGLGIYENNRERFEKYLRS